MMSDDGAVADGDTDVGGRGLPYMTSAVGVGRGSPASRLENNLISI